MSALPARAERALKVGNVSTPKAKQQCTLGPRGQSGRNGKQPLEHTQ